MNTIDAKLDQLLNVLDAQKAKTPTPLAAATPPVSSSNSTSPDAGSPPLANGAAIVPATATATTGTQLQPGWVVRTFPLLSHRFLDKTGDVLSAFVLPESTFHLNDHVPHSLFAKSTKVAYELTGFLDVKEAGDHSLGLIIDEAGSSSCAARASIENQVVFEINEMKGADKAFDPLIGVAKLDRGLYQVQVWIGCENRGTTAPRARIISRSPSMSAPDVLPPGAIGHREL